MSEVNVKSAQHRPGPWWAGLEYDGDSGAYFVHHNGHPIADCNMGYGLEDEANARLIAAAPEMYEALKEARLQIDYMQQKFAVTGTGTAVLGKIDRVIAKAEAR